MSDLPARTWRRWWLEWPKWFRIGFWAAVGAAILQAVLAVRIYFGLMEPAEMTDMRQRHFNIRFTWEDRTLWEANGGKVSSQFSAYRTLLAGLYGKSWSNVAQVDMSYYGTDDDLKFIAAHCPQLEILWARGPGFSSRGVGALGNCTRLAELDLSETDTNNAAIVSLKSLERLCVLRLAGTPVGDDALDVLMEMKSLKGIDLRHTKVTKHGLDSRGLPGEESMPIISYERAGR